MEPNEQVIEEPQQTQEQEGADQEPQTESGEQSQDQGEDEFAGMTESQLREALKKRDAKWNRRLSREVAKRHEAERSAIIAEQMARARREGEQQQQNRQAPQNQAQGVQKPEGWDDWTTAQQVAYIAQVQAREAARQEWAAQEQERERRVQQEQTAREHRQVQSKVQDLTAKGSAAYEDFEDKVFADDLTVTPVMARAMADSDAGHHVMYFLGSNPKEAERIARLSPVAQVREIGKLEVKFEKGITTSKAPKPGTPAGTRGAPSTGVHDELPIGEWMKREQARLRQNRP